IVKQHTGTVGRTFKPELDRPPSFPQKYASSCRAWLPRLSLLKRFSNDVQRLILSNLDYQFLIFLATVNRHFYRTAHSQRIVTPRDKIEFVMRVAKDFTEHWASKKRKDRRPGNLECYWCFRVRTPQLFDVLQANTAYFGPQDQLGPFRRFGIGCGVRTGLHAPSGCIVT
ncbi:hypothetical protein IWW34DRAFT_567587, partial [Fusarium oxysporum f. sp. albedinis]